jgi:hypothetical protein
MMPAPRQENGSITSSRAPWPKPCWCPPRGFGARGFLLPSDRWLFRFLHNWFSHFHFSRALMHFPLDKIIRSHYT